MAALRPAAAPAADIRTYQVYDREGRLVQTIEGDGSLTAFGYDQSNRLIRTTIYYNKLSSAQLDGFRTTPPLAPVAPPAAHAGDSVARNFYDKDGRLIGGLDGGR